MLNRFRTASVKHVDRAQNFKADLLSKLATTKVKGQHHTMIHATPDRPTVTLAECNTIETVTPGDKEWMAPIIQFIQHVDTGGIDDLIMRKKAS